MAARRRKKKKSGEVEGGKSRPRLDKVARTMPMDNDADDAGGMPDEDMNGMKDGGKWIAEAIKRPGALHRALHVPQGEKIPAKKMAKAAHSDNPRVRREAALAKTLKSFHH